MVFEPALFQFVVEVGFRAWLTPRAFCVSAPGREQGSHRGELPLIARLDVTFLVEPLAQNVLGGEIVFGRLEHRWGTREPVCLLPVHTTVDQPSQDARRLGA